MYPIGSGVPQGSILGPLLCLVDVNNLEDCFPEGVRLAGCVDDTTMYYWIRVKADVPDACGVLQASVYALVNWRGGQIGMSPLSL